jgi:hypothetical protein
MIKIGTIVIFGPVTSKLLGSIGTNSIIHDNKTILSDLYNEILSMF